MSAAAADIVAGPSFPDRVTRPTRAATRRPRNAEASREALLAAATRLFSERGFEQTTVRDIGELAGVDPALIARYFGSKVNLYLATVLAEDSDAVRPEELAAPHELLDWFVARIERRGPGPVLQAVVRSDSTPEIREAARGHLTRRLVDPLTRLLTARGVAQPQVRAEVAASALVGVLLARAIGSFGALSALSRAELVELVRQMVPDLD